MPHSLAVYGLRSALFWLHFLFFKIFLPFGLKSVHSFIELAQILYATPIKQNTHGQNVHAGKNIELKHMLKWQPNMRARAPCNHFASHRSIEKQTTCLWAVFSLLSFLMVHNGENQERAHAQPFLVCNNSNGIAVICPDWCYYWIENSIFTLSAIVLSTWTA